MQGAPRPKGQRTQCASLLHDAVWQSHLYTATPGKEGSNTESHRVNKYAEACDPSTPSL